MTTPPGSTVIAIPGGRRIMYPQTGERLVIDAAQYVKPDPRDARLAELTTALQHIRTLAYDAPSLTVEPAFVLETIALLAIDALAGETQPTATTYEELAI